MQYLQVNCSTYPQVTTIEGMEHQVALTPRQQLLMEIRDKLCGGNAAELARRIGKDPTYINRLFYLPDKKGHKGIGLEIMDACGREFFLPRGFWDRTPPGLQGWEAARSQTLRQLRNDAVHSKDPAARMSFEKALALHDPGGPRRDQLWGPAPSDTSIVVDEAHRSTLPDDFEVPAFLRMADGGALTVASPVAHGLQPILSWQHEDELPPGEFVMVPRLDVHLSAGNGAGTNQVEIQFNEAQPQAFRADWIRQQHFKPKRLAAMTASGDSMEPTIHDGDSLLIDTGHAEVQDGKVYALWYEGGERVKRLYRLPGGGLRIKSDNPAFGPIDLGPEYLGHVRVIGRVVHRSGTGGL